jgi:hypothetical protein
MCRNLRLKLFYEHKTTCYKLAIINKWNNGTELFPMISSVSWGRFFEMTASAEKHLISSSPAGHAFIGYQTLRFCVLIRKTRFLR